MIAGEMAEMDHDITVDVDVEEMEIIPSSTSVFHSKQFVFVTDLFL